MVKPQSGSNDHESSYAHVSAETLEQDQIKQSPSSTATRTQNKRILIVDDNTDIAFTLRIGVEDNDSSMQVYSYDNPATALLDFKPNFYDLSLIDVNMPLMDGFELCENYCRKISTSKCAL
jgi:PleD family two-component response regulator